MADDEIFYCHMCGHISRCGGFVCPKCENNGNKNLENIARSVQSKMDHSEKRINGKGHMLPNQKNE